MLRRLPMHVISRYNWPFWARPAQLWPEGRWRIWLIVAGRGFGKSRAGAEAVRQVVREGRYGRIALVAPTSADARDVMVEGPAGILAVSPKGERPAYEPSKRRLTWPSGAVATCFSAEEPERLRGPQHDFFWADELRAWKYMRETWDMLQFGLRLGQDPRGIVTTTPKPVDLIRELLAREGRDVHVTRGLTFDNAANLAGPFLASIRERYEGTTLGRQELHAEMLDEVPGALWRRRQIDDTRRQRPVGRLVRVGIGVDPTTSQDGSGDECGIVVAGIDDVDRERNGPRGYVLADRTVRGGPKAWAAAVVAAYHEFAANVVVAEGNQGGALVREVLEAAEARTHGGAYMPVEIVYASRGKVARAKPVQMLYEKGRVHHLGAFPQLEDEMVTWLPGTKSPNRIDALVWILTALMLSGAGEIEAEAY